MTIFYALGTILAIILAYATMYFGRYISVESDGYGHDSGTEFWYRPNIPGINKYNATDHIFEAPNPAKHIYIVLISLIPLIGLLWYAINFLGVIIVPLIKYFLGYR